MVVEHSLQRARSLRRHVGGTSYPRTAGAAATSVCRREVLSKLPQGVIRQCRVAKRQDFATEVFWDMMMGNCENYNGSTGPVGVEAHGEISCFSEAAD